MLYLRRSRFFRSMTAANVVAALLLPDPEFPYTLYTLVFAFTVPAVVVFIAVWMGFEKWCRHKGWGKLSDYPEARRQKCLHWLLNAALYFLINVLLAMY